MGYEIRAVGQNPAAARFAGIPVNAVLVKTALLSGGLAALAGWSEVAGLKGHLTLGPVARLWLYRDHRRHAGPAAPPRRGRQRRIFVAGIFVGSDAMSRAAGVPTYIADMLLATALLFMVLAILLTQIPDGARMSDIVDILISASFWAAVIRIASPLIFATMGELICERAGVLNLGIEGIMVIGAFTGWMAVYQGMPLVGRGRQSRWARGCCSASSTPP